MKQVSCNPAAVTCLTSVGNCPPIAFTLYNIYKKEASTAARQSSDRVCFLITLWFREQNAVTWSLTYIFRLKTRLGHEWFGSQLQPALASKRECGYEPGVHNWMTVRHDLLVAAVVWEVELSEFKAQGTLKTIWSAVLCNTAIQLLRYNCGSYWVHF